MRFLERSTAAGEGSGCVIGCPSYLIEAMEFEFFNDGAIIMGKSQDTKKNVKKEPAKTVKEKKAAKKVKKEEKKRQ